MNYITEILGFNDLLLGERLSTGQIALWYALMYVNNKCGWKEWFSVSNRTLELYTGLSRSGIDKARNRLKQIGAIDFKSGGTKASKYCMKSMSKSTQDSTQSSLQDSMQNCTPLNKQNKIKQVKYQTKKSKFNNYEDENEIDYRSLENRFIAE